MNDRNGITSDAKLDQVLDRLAALEQRTDQLLRLVVSPDSPDDWVNISQGA